MRIGKLSWHIRRALVLASFALVAARGAAQDGPPDINAVIARGHLIVAMTSFDNPPFYSEVRGHFEGIDVALAQEIGQALGVKVDFDRTAKTFNAVVDKVRRGEADLAISKISRTYARARVVAFSRPYIRLHHALMFNRLKLAKNLKGRNIITYVRSFDGKLGVIEGSSYATFARRYFPQAVIVPFKTWSEVIQATISGAVDAAYRDAFEIKRITVDHPETTIMLRPVIIADASDSICVVARWNAPRLLAMVNQVIDDRPAVLTEDNLISLYHSVTSPETEH